MAEISLTNTLTRKKEKFVSITENEVGIYSCGPTVYRNIHIGNLRTYIASDILKRVLVFNDYKVKHIKNITDVGHMRTTGSDTAYDPIINEALKEGKTPVEISELYTKAYQEDEKKLNILTADENPKATDHIPEMIEITKKLLEKGFAYESEGKVLDGEASAKREGTKGSGTIYFNVKKFTDYGKLSGNTLDKIGDLLEAVRVSVETDKKDSIDFALWKKGDDTRSMLWDSPWGKGFPGWHIECSAMSTKYLGENFDIHTGGEDLIFPHHEDEIAQSEAVSGKQFVNYWVHAGFLLVENQKMARSASNYYILDDIIKKGFNPLSFRYLSLTAQYRSRLNFTWKALEASSEALNNLYREVSGWGSEAGKVDTEFLKKFTALINDDLNTPAALALTHELVKSKLEQKLKLATLLKFDEVFGIGIKEVVEKSVTIPEQVKSFLNQRQKARAGKDFEKSDKLRSEIANLGFEVIDEGSEQKLKRLN